MNGIEAIVLGCGSSSGTPAVGCRCAVCRSPDPKDRRTRASLWVETGGKGFLIDTGPDLRQQALREGVSQLDAVLYTHPHADHLNGIDDLRAFCYVRQGPVALYGNAFTIGNIRERFGYALHSPSASWDKPVLQPHVVEGPFEHEGVLLTPIPLLHGSWPCLGWRIGNLAWLTDVSAIPDTSLPLLEGLEVLFLDCLREKPYPSHLSVDESFAWAERIGARRTVLIHMTHTLSHAGLTARCPPGVEVGHDGLRIRLPVAQK